MPTNNASKPIFYTVAVTAIILGFYLSSRYSYLLFHSLVEITTVAIGFCLFILAWNARRFLANDSLKLLGVGYAFIALIDLLHTLAFKGMNIFPGYDANLPTQLWIAARYLQAVTLCAAPLFARRRISEHLLFITCFSVVALLVSAVYSGLFPDCFVEGKGLTPFKIVSEYVITAMLLASLLFFRAVRTTFDGRVYRLIVWSICCTAVSELSFTTYLSVYGFTNMLGHLFKLAAFYCIYRALLVTGFREPYELIFRDLTRAEEALRKANDTLEEEVEARTAELRASEEKYRRIVDTASEGIWMVGADGMTSFVNTRMADMLGYTCDEMIGRPVTDFMFAQDIPNHLEKIENRRRGVSESFERRFCRKDGETVLTLASAAPIFAEAHRFNGSFAMFTDITERVRIQELIVQTEKMISVGGLAAGMAHEINNPLGIITQAAQNIERRISPELPGNRQAAAEIGISLEMMQCYFEQRRITEFIVSIREAAARATRIIANVLRFSRHAETAMEQASLVAVLEQALELADNDYDLKKKYDFRSIEIVRKYAPDLPKVPMVAMEMAQVFLNLLKNAAQAMIANPPQRPPRIALRIALEERYAVVEVEDNGPGIPEEIRHRVFEPFFTTKEPGVGTGLGLSVSYMIVTQNHKGLMEVASLPGKGARFTVRLPLDNERISAAKHQPERNRS